MKLHPDVPVSVTSDDSGSGITALINRTTDVAAASRSLTAEEEKLILQKGEHLRKITVARDAVVILVNTGNPVDDMTLDQLRDIFSGSKKNWHDFGGPNKKIEVFTREKESGTYNYFQQHVLKGQPYAKSSTELQSSSAVTQAVEKQPWAIGYVGLGYAADAGTKVKIVKVKIQEGAAAVAPTQASAVDAYPLSRPLIIFVDKEPKPSVQQFVDFCLSDDGQKIVTAAGYVGLK
jgi:phosphate transport system substrate-binding protein